MPLASLRQSSANNRSNDVRLSVLRNMLRAVIVMLIALCGHNAWSQAPRAIKIVVPYPPAGTADIVARLLADQIGRAQGLTMVENRPGATTIGTEAVLRAAPDGS